MLPGSRADGAAAEDHGARFRVGRVRRGGQPLRRRGDAIRSPSGGHVAFAVGEHATHYHILGGNQVDRVSIMRIEKSRMVACRPPEGWTGPKVPLPLMLATAGIPVSRHEA